MVSLPQSSEDWERLNAKSWELPNYGPGPDFGRGTIYRQDYDEYTENKRPDYGDEDDLEDGRPADKYPPHPTSSTVPVTNRPISSVPVVPKRSQIPSQSTFPTQHVIPGPSAGRAQAPEGPIFNERGPNTSSSNTFARPHYSARDLKPGQRTPLEGGHTDTSRPQFQAKKWSAISNTSQYRAKNPPTMPGQNDSHSKAKWRKGFSPDASYRLPYECQVFQEKVRQVTTGEASTLDFRQRIIEDTGAYVRMSAGNARLVHIWGRQKQVLEAQNMLQDMLSQLMRRPTLPRASASRWTKVHAHSVTKVAHARSQESLEERLSEMRKPPKIATDYTLAFLWPSDGPSLNYFVTALRAVLDSIRLSYDVNIYIRPGIPDYLFMSGNHERDMCIIASRFRELWERLMVQYEMEIKLFLVAAPPVELMRTHVILQKSDGLLRPALCGPELAPEVAATWQTTAEEVKLNNKSIVTTRLRKALHVIPQFRGFLQMRAKFGLFTLQQWRKPKDGASYEFSEFREMLAHMNTEGRLLPGIRLQQDEIFKRIMESKFLKPWGKANIKSLPSLMPRYSANFEYQVNDDSIIRVEAKFSLLLGSQEFEVNGIRCYKPQQTSAPVDRQMPMQISMIDFERSDWQLEVKALELCPEKEIPPELDKFLRSIGFQWNPNVKSIASAPKRKARFSYGSPVKRFVEKAAIQLQVKDSPHVFELARFDEYKYGAGHWSMTPKVSWGASLFNPSWDDILGEQVEAKAHDISKDGCLSVFFPFPGDDQEHTDKDKQKMDDEVLKEAEIRKMNEEEQLSLFMGTVQRIARMLSNPGAEISDVLETDLGSLF
ncbi:uncharacterized protein N7479_009387 [Penicillium vulpinum]|uniref:DUF7905 domain-containing protein n=1 Tax=Penicillium vulpinum TaxID=29845 RepID=A0A1V6RUE9_9EURO|nr:uncharacterized protein N7479_009387 [Penicillium vulpinum]KAJ5950974.1 hypothetical protein N7479_009387 [Penicillium vulpinum]OQE05391.1 hypothetical protein PENVUL_c025G01651 [Penicillium vulpinum]